MPTSRNIILRRLAALLAFALLVTAFAALFYLKIIPDNRADLNQRGHKALTQQVQNFLRKDQDLHNIIDNAGIHFPDLLHKKPPYDRLSANMHYAIDTNLPPRYPRHLWKTDTGVWLIVHHPEEDTSKIRIAVNIKDFADPLFSGRDDVFKNYLILLDTADTAGTGELNPAGLYLLYQQLPLSASAHLNADTTKMLAPNSDQSGTFDLSMAGQKYVAFFTRFEFHQQHLLLVGLIDNNEYQAKIHAPPPLFLPMIIILIALVTITLPFLKVFLLSPHESINSGDVLKIAISFYAGGVIVTIVVFYFFLGYVTGMGLQTRLRHFSRLVQSDVEDEIRNADIQLKDYATLPANADTTMLSTLATDTLIPGLLEDEVDIACSPKTDLLISRLLWLDSGGTTIAKWSPYKYPTPFTHLGNYVFYQLLVSKPAFYDGIAGVDVPVLYPGKSNLTGEFQTFIARQDSSWWPPDRYHHTDTSHQAFYMGICDILRASLQPVIPPGFDFSLIDNDGNVLVDGDPRKSLGGNLFEEAEQKSNLREAVRFDKGGWSFPLDLRGVSYNARVTAIEGQPLHLVCYYSRDIVLKNVNRLMHFSIETLVLLWCLLGICLLLSTFNQWKPVLLKFNFEKIEWIRPASNKANLPAISRWLLGLVLNAVIWFAFVSFLSTTLTPLFYLSLLLPFYVVLGIQIFHDWKGKYYTGIAIFFLDAIICWIIPASGSSWLQAVPVFGFQLLAVFLLSTTHRPRTTTRLTGDDQPPGPIAEPLAAPQLPYWLRRLSMFWKRNEYFGVLYLSIFLISILPTLGILNYAFFAEKVQYKKEKLDAISSAFTKRSNYLLTSLIPWYKPTILQTLDSTKQKKLLFGTSIYLTDRDTIIAMPEARAAGIADTARAAEAPETQRAPETPAAMPDALYGLLMDNVYFAPVLWEDAVTIGAGNPGGHGTYAVVDDTAVQYAPGKLLKDSEIGAKSMLLRSHLQKPHADLLAIFLPVGLSVGLLLIALGYLAGKLVRGAIHHLFLLEIVGNACHFVTATSVVATAIDGFTNDASWMKEVNDLFGTGITVGKLNFERSFDGWPLGAPPDQALQTDFILAMADYLGPAYAVIFWNRLTDEEKYVLYDFATDRYTNYKNSAVLYRLISKGVLVSDGEYLDVFSLSFRQYVLSIPDGDDASAAAKMQKLLADYQIPGTWQSIRVPAIAILLLLAVFLYTTSPQFSTLLAAAVALGTSLTGVIAFVRSSFTSGSK